MNAARRRNRRRIAAGLAGLICAAAAAAQTPAPPQAQAGRPGRRGRGGGEDGAPPGVRVISDVAYLEPGRAEKLDLYIPLRRVRPHPVSPAVVVIHGAGWVAGDKHDSRERSMATDLAQAGYVAASINYRLGDGAWPTDLYDCKNAVRFLRSHAAEYGIDTEHVAVLGGSAGGHLALMTGLTTDQPGLEPSAPYPGVSSRVTCILDFYGPTDLVDQLDPSGREPVVMRYDIGATKVFGIPRDAPPSVWRKVSPIAYVKTSSPPVMVLHGHADPSVDYEQAFRLVREMERQGVPHEFIVVEGGVGHAFNFQTDEHGRPLPHDLRPAIFDFLARYMPVHNMPLHADSLEPPRDRERPPGGGSAP